jgi:hypothetical protein
MNTHEHGAPGPATRDERPLPELSDERVEHIENRVFGEIARQRQLRSSRRRTGWWIGGAAAAVIVVAAVIAPSVGSMVGGFSTTEAADAPAVGPATGSGSSESDVSAEVKGLTDSAGGSATADLNQSGAVADPARDIITTATATVVVTDVAAASATIASSAQAHDGYVESMSIGQSGQVIPVEPMDGGIAYDPSMPYPYTPDGAWVTVRVPADQLAAVTGELATIGEVTASSTNRQDVTAATLDLEARISAAQASVDRLTLLMTQAGSLADLIAAESALSERQATLESYQQQLKYYDDQVAMSTLTVTLTPEQEVVTADPAGFGDGLAAGWNGLVATLNGIVVAIGFLLPWLAIIALAALIVWGIVRLVRRRRQTPSAPASTATTTPAGADGSDRAGQ